MEGGHWRLRKCEVRRRDARQVGSSRSIFDDSFCYGAVLMIEWAPSMLSVSENESFTHVSRLG